MAKKSKVVVMTNPVVEPQQAPETPAPDAFDPIVPLRAVAEKCLPGMRNTWWAGLEAFARLHSVNVEGAPLSKCLAVLHAWGGGTIALKPYL